MVNLKTEPLLLFMSVDGKKNGRELASGQCTVFSAQRGPLDKYSRPFDHEKIAPGIYKN